MRFIKRITNKTLIFATIFALLAAFLAGSLTLAFSAKSARAEDTAEFEPTSIGLSNPDFSEVTGSFPKSPSSWTGASVGSGDADIVTGVVDLTPSTYVGENSGNEKFKLDRYPEYSEKDKIPVTIFGSGSEFENSDANALLINTAEGAETVYAYSSSDMTFEASSFYRVSAWVKTGDFASDSGATVKLSGLDKECKFININTVRNINKENGVPVLNADNRYGWVKYTMYVATPSSSSSTVKLVLGIGDTVDNTDDVPVFVPSAAQGYAFFDTVKAERISASDFSLETSGFELGGSDYLYYNADKTALAVDLFDANYLTVNDGTSDREIGTFSDNHDLWDMNAVYDENSDSDAAFAGSARALFYDASITVDPENNVYGLTKNPRSPLGVSESEIDAAERLPVFPGTNSNILMISSYNETKDSFEKAAYGIASPSVTVERFKYYRLGVWYKGDGIKDGAGLTVGVKGETNDTSVDNKLAKWYNNLTADSSDDAAHYGWAEQVVYIKGSVLSDLDIHFELWLGSPDSPSSGIAMFDNITFTEISSAEYAASSSNGSTLSLDATVSDTGVTNGMFTDIAEYDELSFPLPASNWSVVSPELSGNVGFSSAKVDSENAVCGIIPTGDAFDNLGSDAKLAQLKNPSDFLNAPLYNAFVLSSSTPTAIGYRSADITIATDKGYKLSVDLAVDGMKSDDYGASLVLRTSDGKILSTIENITETNNAFKQFTFYVDAPSSDKTVNVEIWLGLCDRKNNTTKLSSGNVYVKKVAAEEWTAAENSSVSAEYQSRLLEYKSALTNKTLVGALDYGMYSFNAPVLDYYDIYSYNRGDGLAVPYTWSMTAANTANTIYGIFNTDNMQNVEISGFDKKDRSGNMLFIQNTLPNRTTLTYDNTISIVANTYYRLDVTLKVRMTDEQRKNNNVVGATLTLTGAKTESFENIKDTTKLVAENDEGSRDYETFKTYSFLISSGSNGGDIGLTISFGGETRTSYAEGQLIIADISLNSINNTAFESVAANLTDYQKAVYLSEASETDDSDQEVVPSTIEWWIIPTVIFSAALLIAVVIIIVIRVRDHFKKKKKTTYTSEYDRVEATKKLDSLNNRNNTDGHADSKADTLDDDVYSDKSDANNSDEETETVNDETAETAAPVSEDNSDAAQEEAQNGEDTAEQNAETADNASEEKEPVKDKDADLDD